jgi:glycosyltransferase involved in cell wall biosynthesis
MKIPVTWVGQSTSQLARLRAIVSEIRRDRPEVFQSQHFYTNAYVLAAGRLAGAREVGAIRCDFCSEVSGRYATIRRVALAGCRTIAANSKPALESAVAAGVPSRRLHLLPNVVDTAKFRPSGREPGEVFEILGAGRLTEQKRFDRFLRIVERLRNSSSRCIRATIAGAGPLGGTLRRQASEAGLTPDAVRFTGAVDDLRELYHRADAFLLTSDFEGTPNVVLEAMACGLPVVSSRVGGVAAITAGGRYALLADPNDEHALESNMRELLLDAELRNSLAQEARMHVVDNFSVDSLHKYLCWLYESVLAR